MMGTKGGDQNRLFYSFNLEKHVPADHLLRRIDHFLDLSELRRQLEPFYSHTGRPSVDPELLKLPKGSYFDWRTITDVDEHEFADTLERLKAAGFVPTPGAHVNFITEPHSTHDH